MSRALTRWNGQRARALDRLEAAHRAVTGGRAGRQHYTDELNRALVMRLAAEWQGFCTELYEEAAGHLLTPALAPNPAVQRVYRQNLERNRKLSHGNAGASNLAVDFAFLGVRLWRDIEAATSRATKGDLHEWVEWLNDARNGIAHGDEAKIAAAAAKHRITLSTVRQARRKLTRVAGAMEQVVGAHLNLMTGVAPW